ncbi:MAG: tetratricopeptide repeat protein [Thermoanaerobaculia bacterium]|nr:tetratricopeptide repeat protein [Thermoanaerobaculia bacterium]
MFCQVCGALQSDEADYCERCHQKLLVLSGPEAEEIPIEESPEESFSFDEHLLERISIHEEVLKRTAEAVRDIFSTLQKQEKNILINHTGLGALADLLDSHGVVSRESWGEEWEGRAQSQLLALEKRERFAACREKISALYHGGARDQFLQHLRQADVHFLSFELDAAVAELEAALDLDPGNYSLAHFLGETYFNERDSDTALARFERALELKPDHFECLVYSGVIRYERGELGAAEERLGTAAVLYPEAFLPLFCLGAIQAAKGDLDTAVVCLERATEIDPVPQAYYLLGNCHYEMGKPQPAIRALKEAVALDPRFEEAHHLLGLAYLERHWNRKALEAFREAQHLNPKKLRYDDFIGFLSGDSSKPLPGVEGEAAEWLERAEASLAREDGREALRCYRRAMGIEPENPTVLMSHALACLHLDRHEESELATRRVLDLNPGEMLKTTAYALLMEALRGEGRYREGNQVGTRLLDEGTSNFAKTIAYYEMAYNLAELEEDLDQALDYARLSLELAPDEFKQFPLAALGWIHYKRREYDRAVEFLSRSSELGQSSQTLNQLGMALLASGDEVEARDVLSRARSLDGRADALHDKMMEFLRDSTRLFEALEFSQRD